MPGLLPRIANGPTAAEAIRKAVLLRAAKPPAWLADAAGEAETQIANNAAPDGDGESEDGESE